MQPRKGLVHSQALGLAISGGVDSMAMAALCSRVQHEKGSIDFSEVEVQKRDQLKSFLKSVRFQAFVVDHGARKGSDGEAQAVSKILEERGIQTKVLTVDWNDLSSPGVLPNFESAARKHRYQLMGKACRASGIDSLLMAHHDDDQAETVMMRLINGHGTLGLRGMKPTAEIPECHGTYGVHESGDLDAAEDEHASKRNWKMKQKLQGVGFDSKDWLPAKLFSSFAKQLPAESGGVRIHRPLLQFSKTQLVATCLAEDMKWFEDSTNKDPTVTRRNAIRHVMNSYGLPPALSKPALLQLCGTANQKYNVIVGEAEALLSQCDLVALETRSGIVRVRFPQLAELEQQSCPTREGKRLVAALLLRRIIELVTPEEHPSLLSIGGIIKNVFPELRSPNTPEALVKAFSVASVQFRSLGGPNASVDCPLRKVDWVARGLQDRIWLIYRQPYVGRVSQHPLLTIKPLEAGKQPQWSNWRLYDGRFWVRTKNSSPDSFRVRPFYKDDMIDFRTRRSEAKRAILHSLLKELAPGDVRWTLPAIARVGTDRKEILLGLPTLGIKAEEAYRSGLAWQVRYKKIDTRGFRSLDRGQIQLGVKEVARASTHRRRNEM